MNENADIIVLFRNQTLRLLSVTTLGKKCLSDTSCHQLEYALFEAPGSDSDAIEQLLTWLEARSSLCVV